MGEETVNTKNVALCVVLALFAGLLVVAVPYAWRAGTLYRAKSAARSTLSRLTPDELRKLNSIPTAVDIQPKRLDAGTLETIEIGGCVMRVPQPTTRADTEKSILLTYPHYDARIRRPFSLTETDSVARQLHFKDTFDQYSAAYHTRTSDLDAAQDAASLQLFLLLISQKPSLIVCREEFTCDQIRGFIFDPEPGMKMTVIEVFNPRLQTGLGIWMTDHNAMTIEDAHEFLSTFQLISANRVDALK